MSVKYRLEVIGMAHILPELGYEYDALEPYVDKETMRLHHSKHHQAYVNKLNAALKGHEDLMAKSVEELIKNIENIPEAVRTAVRNNGGGHLNHSFFWTVLKKNTEPHGEVLEAIKEKFGSFDQFNEHFSGAAATQFGSGWAWLVVNRNRGLDIMQTSNQNSPVSMGSQPLLTIDVWEHAYYLKYQNRRPEYIEAFFKVIDWDRVNEYFVNAEK